MQDQHIQGDQPAHLVTPATVYSPSREALTFNAAIDSGSSFNFMSQLKVKELQLTNGVSPTQKPRGIDGNSIRVYLEYKIDVFTSDSAGRIARTESVFLGADIGGFNMILGRPWLKTVTPIIDLANEYWTHQPLHDLSKTVDLALLNASEFEAECSMEGTLAFMVAISDILEVDNKVQATPVPTIPAGYLDLAEVFSEGAANTLPDHGL